MIVYRIYDPIAIIVEYRDEYGEAIIDLPIGCAIEDRPYSAADAMQALRAERNRRLMASDYTQLPDVAIDAATQIAWRAYRQALRDITDDLVWGSTTWPDLPV